MPDYIPGTEAGKMYWLGNFDTWMINNGTLHSFTAAEIAALTTLHNTADTSVTDNIAALAAARSSTTAKHGAIANAINVSRDYVQRLQADPNMTDADRSAAGITVPDPTKTATDPDDILKIKAPLIELDFSVRRQITIHWGPNPGNEHENGRPKGVIGCQIQYHVGGVPEHEADWITLDVDSDSPFIHTVHEDTATTYTYRACYIGKTLKRGPYGDPVECTVSI